MELYEKAEVSIVKKYRSKIWIPFISAVKKYRLIEEGDKIAVCISGGKDSTLMAKCIQRLQKYSDFPFSAEYLVMDPGYSKTNRKRIEANSSALHLPVRIFNTNIFEIAEKADRSPCYLCAKMRRGCLYKHARELGCNKIALGHHLDDVVETTLMSMLYSAEIRTMMPKLHSAHYGGMELIRPLYLVHESDIISWGKFNGLQLLRCACRFTENCSDGLKESKRQKMKQLIAELKQENPDVDKNIFHSTENVNLDTVVAYKKDGISHSFLDDYAK